jgi:uncharacterized protein YneF (UPF0154 family)
MITIIITALVSVFLTLVVGYFIWQFISVRKLKKQVKDNSNNIKDHVEWIKAVEECHQRKIEEVYDNLRITSDECHIKIDENDKKVGKITEEIYQQINRADDELHRELDKRFDKIYQILKQKE